MIKIAIFVKSILAVFSFLSFASETCSEPFQLSKERGFAMGQLRLHHRLGREELAKEYQAQVGKKSAELHAEWSKIRIEIDHALGKARDVKDAAKLKAFTAQKSDGLDRFSAAVLDMKANGRAALLLAKNNLLSYQAEKRTARWNMLQTRIPRALDICSHIKPLVGKDEELEQKNIWKPIIVPSDQALCHSSNSMRLTRSE